MSKEFNDNLYYVIENSAKYDEIEIAKFNDETKQFYDYHLLEYVPNIKEFKVGELVKLDWKMVYKLDGYINNEVIKAVINNHLFYRNLRKKYGTDEFDGPYGCDNRECIPTIDEIIIKYANDKIEEGVTVDLYVIDVIRILSEAMGLRICWNKGGSCYLQMSPFKFAEELYEVVDLMYKIISRKFAMDESFCFELYEFGGKGKEFEEFIEELEKNSRYKAEYFGSDLEDRIRNEDYHGANWGVTEGRRVLTLQKPTIYFSPEMTTYYYDRAVDNSNKLETTPELANEHYKRLIKSSKGVNR